MEKKANIAGRAVFIGIPAGDGKIDVRIAGAILEAKHILQQHGCSVGMGWITYCSSISRARNSIAAKFMSLDPVWSDLLMIDADTVPRFRATSPGSFATSSTSPILTAKKSCRPKTG